MTCSDITDFIQPYTHPVPGFCRFKLFKINCVPVADSCLKNFF